MSSVVPIGTFLLVLCFILQVVGVATEHWLVVSIFSGLVEPHGGLFKLCDGVTDQCFYYVSYAGNFLNVHYLGIVGFSCLGILLLFIAVLIGFCGCSKPNPKPTVQNLSGVGLFGGLASGAGVLWYYLYIFKGTFGDITILLSGFGVDIGPGWSFYLCCGAGGGATLISIMLMIISCNMPTSNGVVLPAQQPTTVIAMTGGHLPMNPHYNQPGGVAMQNPAHHDPFAPQPNQGYN